MARLRKFSGYRSIERPYTRKSKYRAKSYVRASPPHKIVRFDMGNIARKFSYRLELRVKEALQIRHNAIESARQSSNRLMEKKAGKTEYSMKIRKYPHHVLRENPLASGAGADRMSTGMQKAFGKPIGVAAQFKVKDIFMSIDVEEAHLATAREALVRAKNKLPCRCAITVVKLN